MKHVKTFESNEVCDSETTKLFQELKYHDTKHREIDHKLSEICKSKLEPYLLNDKLSDFEIKKVFYAFYKNCYNDDPEDKGQTFDFSFEKDMVMMWLNKKLKLREEERKYNL